LISLSHFAGYPVFLSSIYIARLTTFFQLSCLFPFFPRNSFFQLPSM
jgi:hypothetical protein